MRRQIARLGLLLVGLAVLAAAAFLVLRPRPALYTVVAGDTLFEIAREHGVTVAQLRGWNDIEGDLIEVDQVLVIWTDAAVAPEVPPGARKTIAGGVADQAVGSVATALAFPTEKECLPSPSVGLLEAEEGFLSSQGLSYEQIRDAMDRFIGHTLSCVPEGTAPSGTIHTQIRVACTGRVAHVEVEDDGGLTAEMVECVREMLYYAPFPAHDLPEGEVFGYPLTFRFDG